MLFHLHDVKPHLLLGLPPLSDELEHIPGQVRDTQRAIRSAEVRTGLHGYRHFEEEAQAYKRARDEWPAIVYVGAGSAGRRRWGLQLDEDFDLQRGPFLIKTRALLGLVIQQDFIHLAGSADPYTGRTRWS